MSLPGMPRHPLPYLCVGHSIDHMFMLLYPTVVVLALESEMGRSYGELLALATGGFVMFGLGAPLAGWLADRWSATGMITLFFVGIGASTILTGFADSPAMLFVSLTLMGLFAAIYHPVGISMILQTAGDKRGRYLGINGVFGSAGMGVAALVAGGLTAWLGWRAAFIIPGIVSILLGVLFALQFRDGIEVTVRKKDVEEAEGGLSGFVRVMIILSVITVAAGMVFQALTVGLPKILDHRVAFLEGGGAFGVGVAVTAIMLIGGAAQLLGGYLADRFPLKMLFFAVYGMMAPALLLASLAADGALIVLLILAVAITVGNQPVSDSLFARYVPPKWLSTAFGFRFALSLTVSAVAIPTVGLVFDWTGDFFWLFMLLAAFAAAVVAAIAMLPSRTPGEAVRPAKPVAVPAE